MDWHTVLGIAGGLLFVASTVLYVRDMLYGTTRPSLISQGLWLFINGILAAAQFAAGGPWGAFLALAAALCNLIIVVIILRGYGYTRYNWSDGVCLVLALLAIFSWQVTNDPRAAIIFALISYVFSVTPTIVKTYRVPSSEHIGAWIMVIIAAVCSILAANTYDFANLAFPIYALAEASTIAGIAFFGRPRAV